MCPERRDDVGDEVDGDDRIIGRALRLSAFLLAGLGLAAALAALLLWREPAPVPVAEDAPEAARRLGEALDRPAPALPFEDVTAASGIAFAHRSGAYGERLLPETMGGGVAVFDYDADGDPDLLFVDSRDWPWRAPAPAGGAPRLYRNDGAFRFTDVTVETGLDRLALYGMGVAVADLDGDGFRDVYLTAVGENRLLRNVAGRRFEDVTAAWNAAGGAADWSTSAAFFDADSDGDLDLFVCNYVEWSREIDQAVDYRLTGIGRAYGPPTNYGGTFSRLFRNDGRSFVDVSAESGIRVTNAATGLPAGKALAVRPVDLDDDGLLDLVVANDTVANFLFHNRGGGRFAEIGMESGLAFDNTGSATGAMGLDAAVLGGAGQVAVAVGNFANEMTSFYLGARGSLLFSDAASLSGIGPGSRQALSFGLFFFDADLDGRLDLLQTNGHVEDEINVVQPSQHYEQPTQLFWQCGPDCARTFVQLEADAIGDLASPLVGRGAAYADFDGDGDLDVVITQVNRPPRVLRNDSALGHHWLRVRVGGTGANRDAIGAAVRISTATGVQEALVMPTRSYLSQVELPVTFGLGTATQVAALSVSWPDGASLSLRDVAADQVLDVPYPGGGP